jgi:glycerol-3-phosphate acyltransferase PlsY
MLGHCFPVWLKFKGGKGVATSLGVFFAINFGFGLVISVVWIMVAKLSKTSSLSALIASLFAPFYAFCMGANTNQVLWLLLITSIIWIRHKENIIRLLQGKESKINLNPKI